MRYSRAEVEALKTRLPLADYLVDQGVNLQKAGRSLRALCPLHAEKTPSFYVYPEQNRFYCYGCQAKGDLIDYVRLKHDVGFQAAMEMLGQQPTVSRQSPSSGKAVNRRENVSIPNLEWLLEGSRAQLAKSATAQAYLESRGLDSKTIQHFEVGFEAGDSQYDAQQASALKAIGYLSDRGYPLYRGRVMVPIRDEAGRIRQLYGRHIGNSSPKHRYLRLPHTTLFNPKALEYQEINLCESIIDAMTLYANGFPNSCSIDGANSLKLAYLDQMQRAGVRSVAIAFDNDRAGNQAAEATQLALAQRGIDSTRWKLPEGKDINDIF